MKSIEARVTNQQIKERPKRYLTGKNRLLALSLFSLLLAGCDADSFLAPPPLPTSAPTLSPSAIAQFCGEKTGMGLDNPYISAKEENDIRDMLFQLSGPQNFPPNSGAGITLDSMRAAISPDHTKVAFTSLSRNIMVVNKDGSNPVVVSVPPKGLRDEEAQWSPDGKTIIFERHDYQNSSSGLHAVNADGSKDMAITSNPPAVEDASATFLKDGRILFVREDTRNADPAGYYIDDELYTMNPDGSKLKQIKINDYPAHTIEFMSLNPSIDGARVAFILRNNAGYEVVDPMAYGAGVPYRAPSIDIFDSSKNSIEELDRVRVDPSSIYWTKNGEYLRYYQYPNEAAIMEGKAYLTKIDKTAKYECPSGPSPTVAAGT